MHHVFFYLREEDKCLLIWTLRSLARKNAESQCVHLCGFSPLWVSLCSFRCEARPNEFPHTGHLWTFSPEWVIMCLFNLYPSANDLLHSEQVCIFTSVWVSRCLVSCDIVTLCGISSWSDLKEGAPPWNCLSCLFRFFGCKHFLHLAHSTLA